jgi:phospholipid/cholesterol/gamma-HCH transport system substrate-binding protein
MRGRTTANLAIVSVFALLCMSGIGFLAVSMGLEVPGLWQGWRLEASFAGVQGLVAQSDVNVAGVHVGHVAGIRPDGQGGALVSMVVDGNVHLRQDVRAVLRPKSAIGEKFVELVRKQGSSAPFVSDGYTVPRAQTGQAVEIDDLLNKLDPTTRAAFSQSLRELGVATNQRAADINAAIPDVEQAAANLRPLARTADARQAQIDRILHDLAVIMAGLADEQDALGRAISSGDTTTTALVNRDRQLAGTVQQADKLLISLDSVLADTTAANRASLAQAPGTITSGRALLTNLNPAVDRLLPELLLAQVNYPNNQLSVAAPDANTLAYEWISAFAQNDAQGHSFRITSVVDPSTLVRQPALPTTLPQVPTLTPTTPAQAAVPGATPSPGPTPDQGLGGLLPPVVKMLLGMP